MSDELINCHKEENISPSIDFEQNFFKTGNNVSIKPSQIINQFPTLKKIAKVKDDKEITLTETISLVLLLRVIKELIDDNKYNGYKYYESFLESISNKTTEKQSPDLVLQKQNINNVYINDSDVKKKIKNDLQSKTTIQKPTIIDLNTENINNK